MSKKNLIRNLRAETGWLRVATVVPGDVPGMILASQDRGDYVAPGEGLLLPGVRFAPRARVTLKKVGRHFTRATASSSQIDCFFGNFGPFRVPRPFRTQRRRREYKSPRQRRPLAKRLSNPIYLMSFPTPRSGEGGGGPKSQISIP